MDAGIWDAGAVVLAAVVGLGGSGFVVKQAREAQRTAEAAATEEKHRREIAETAREFAEQRKLDQTAFDRFERHNQQVIEQLTQELSACKEITGAAVGYTQSLHDHMLVVHEELRRNQIAVPPMPRVPEALSKYPWIPWKSGLTYEDASGGLNGQGHKKDGHA